jgi:hypothetical protein
VPKSRGRARSVDPRCCVRWFRRGHYELAAETIRPLRVAAAFAELAQAI